MCSKKNAPLIQNCDFPQQSHDIMTMCCHSLKGETTVKNTSGDTVIGEQADVYGMQLWLKKQTTWGFTFADGSNSFLKVSSHSGGIDVYVGEGGSAELHSQEGKYAL